MLNEDEAEILEKIRHRKSFQRIVNKRRLDTMDLIDLDEMMLTE